MTKIIKEVKNIINLMEKAKTIDDGKIGLALLRLYNLEASMEVTKWKAMKYV